ncbi:MAG: hypothetical protein RLZ97_2042 [Verrucomicrobiota bacterium]
MNTKPDDEWLALWLEDELDPERTEQVDAWAAGEPEWLEHRAAARALKPLFNEASLAAADVPHAEFFNARIRREIEKAAANPAAPAVGQPARTTRRAWLVPLTAAAGIALGFWAGRGAPGGTAAPLPPPVADLAPVLYTPEKGVAAEFVSSGDTTVIVLAGVAALPDEWSIPETAAEEPETRPMADLR